METMIYWIWLSLACTPGSTTFGKLIKKYKDAKEIYEADGKSIASVIGYRTSDRSSLEDKSLDRAEEIYNFCIKHKVGIVTYADEGFPAALRTINDPPVLLYYRGRLPDFNRIFPVAMVGMRLLSEYGRKNAFRLGYDLAKAGTTVVSGMAIGIDGVSMAGALAAGGTTVAVIGSGIDVCYPPQHLRLAREIVKNGCVMTEYAPGTNPHKFNFPKRNRLISGLSVATLVIEGEERSGALFTARYAKEQGRKVYALPGNVGAKTSELTSLLIKDGAAICTKAEDILNDYSKGYPFINSFALTDRLPVNMTEVLREYEVCAVCPNDDCFDLPKFHKKKPADTVKVNNKAEYENEKANTPPANFDKDALEIYKRIPSEEPCSIESLVFGETNLRIVMRHLLKLEMNGFIRLLPGEMVCRKLK